MQPPIALLAGEGQMPRRVLEGIREAGRRVLLIGVEGQTLPELAQEADETVWFRHLKLGKLRKELANRGVCELTLAGRVPHTGIFPLANLDFEALKLVRSLPDMRADTVLRGVADFVAGWGVTLISSVAYLGRYLAREGVLTRKGVSEALMAEIEFGARVAKQLGRADVGQTVVVKNRAVVAVEAMEGTDSCLERAGQLAGRGCTVVKLPKPDQDMRFDVPVIGINTIEKLHKIEAKAIAIGAGRTLLIDPETCHVADGYGITIVSINDSKLD